MLTVFFCIGGKKWRELPGSKEADQRIKGFHHLFFFGPCLCCSARAHSCPKRKQSQSIPAMLHGQILNLVSNLSLLSEEIWGASLLNPTEFFRLLATPFPLSLMHVTNLSTETAAIWVPKRAQTMKHRSYKHDEQVTNVCHLVSYPECFDVPKRAVLCWFMNKFYLCYHKALLSSWQPKGKILAVFGECGGQANAPHFSCSRIKAFLSLMKQQQCQDNPCRQGWKAALPVESPYPSYCVFPLVFVFSQVLGLHCGCKGWQLIRVSPLSTSWRTLCQLLCPATSMHVNNPLYQIVCAWIF